MAGSMEMRKNFGGKLVAELVDIREDVIHGQKVKVKVYGKPVYYNPELKELRNLAEKFINN